MCWLLAGKRLEEDLAELVSDRLHIAQRLATIHRMHRTYGFLQPSASQNALMRRLMD